MDLAGVAARSPPERPQRQRQTGASPPPKGIDPRTSLVFGLTMRFAATRSGAGGTIIVPHPNLSAKAVPPLWQYLAPVQEPDEPIPAPKGSESRTPQTFSPANGAASWGPRRGPRLRSRTLWPATLSRLAPPLVVGEGHAPVVAVLVTSVSKNRLF